MNCISIEDKTNCCGCRACAEACPEKCIKMVNDNEGFAYPEVNADACVECGKCVKVCPVLNHFELNDKIEQAVYGATHFDKNIIETSSSGGAFSAITDAFCQQDFAVFGVAFDSNLKVVHDYALTLKDTEKFKKSKYVESDTNGCFSKAEDFLKKGKNVLFTGTPCQIAALRLFLKKDYDKLLCVDLICHGVPSQSTFDKHIAEKEKEYNKKIIDVKFRNKVNPAGKSDYRNIKIFFESGKPVFEDISKNHYLKGFHNRLFYRPSCSKCAYANPDRPGDITIADCWGIQKLYPELNPKTGISMIVFNSEKGRKYLENIQKAMKCIPLSLEFAKKSNAQFSVPATNNPKRAKFFKLVREKNFSQAVYKCLPPRPMVLRVASRLLPSLLKNTLRKVLKSKLRAGRVILS